MRLGSQRPGASSSPGRVKGFDASMVPARDWFLEHLQP
jgi:hypothetical protein